MAAQAGADPKIVSQVLKDMDRRGIIKKARNHVAILDHEALSLWSCECYALCEDDTQAYLEALTAIAQAHGGSTNPDGREPLQ